jgi:DNA replication protein DnaC
VLRRDARRSALYRQLATFDLIVIDDFGLTPLSEGSVGDLLEILDDRYYSKPAR